MGKVISVSMQKGGTGKTTTAINLSAAFAERHYRVLLWDFDPQAGATVGLGYDPDELSQTTYHVLSGERDPQEIILPTATPGLALAPASWDLMGLEMEVARHQAHSPHAQIGLSWEITLRQMLAPLAADYDFIVVDNPPHPGPLTILALVAADLTLIPVQCEILALRALKQLYKLIADVQLVNPDMAIKVLRTQYDRRKKHHCEVFEEIAAVAGDQALTTYIKDLVLFPDATGAQRSVLQFASGSEAATAYRRLAQEILQHYQL
jgi:chromosome partitioning protein